MCAPEGAPGGTLGRTPERRWKDAGRTPRIRQCEERFTQLVGDIFIGNEMVPDVIETPPRYPLELTYRYRTRK